MESQMIFKPNGTRLLVEVVQETEILYGPIVVVDQNKRSQHGIVIECGVKEDGSPLHFKKGDKVMFSSVAGSNINFNGKAYLLLRQEEIWGTILES